MSERTTDIIKAKAISIMRAGIVPNDAIARNLASLWDILRQEEAEAHEAAKPVSLKLLEAKGEQQKGGRKARRGEASDAAISRRATASGVERVR